jgi:Tat protein secretion system quality control protein TatD with DNase activity
MPSNSPTPPESRSMPKAAAAKLDQIKDLYLTAEAIGEDALDKHFDQVSQRQRELINEFFERSKRNGNPHS